MAASPNKALSHVASPRASLKSAASTLRSTHLREKQSRHELHDLATTVDVSEVIDATEVGQLTSPLLPQEREVSVNFLRSLWFLGTFKRAAAHAGCQAQGNPRATRLRFQALENLCEVLSHFLTLISHCLKVTKSRTGECATFSHGKGKVFVEALVNSLKRKLIELFQDNLRL